MDEFPKTESPLSAKNTKVADYEIGYGKPPKETRFKPGQSGNRGGRPRGARNKAQLQTDTKLRNLILKESQRQVDVREGDKVTSIPMLEAMVRTLSAQALRGNLRAQKMMLDFTARAQFETAAQQRADFEFFVEYKHNMESKLDHCRRSGIEPPEMIPHPDDIHIDARTGEFWICGPISKEEKEQLEIYEEQIQNRTKDIDAIKQELLAATDPDDIKMWTNALRETQELLCKFQLLRNNICQEPGPAIALQLTIKKAKILLEELGLHMPPEAEMGFETANRNEVEKDDSA